MLHSYINPSKMIYSVDRFYFFVKSIIYWHNVRTNLQQNEIRNMKNKHLQSFLNR